VRFSHFVAAVAAAVVASSAAAQGVALDASAAVKFYVSRADGGEAHPYADFARWALDAWSEGSDGALEFVETDSESDAVIRLYWVGEGINKYGEMRGIEVNGKPGAEVYIITATDGLGADIHKRADRDRLFRESVVYLTCVHEIGHAVGMRHTDKFADIMYSFQHGGNIKKYFLRYRNRVKNRSDMRNQSPLSDNDIALLRALY
jgi:predicted Zn-dependent protease